MSNKVSDIDKHMSAITFAEAGEHETARDILSGGSARTAKASTATSHKKSFVGAFIFGALSLTGYFFLLSNQKWVTTTFTMGGWHAVFPVGTAFLFSFIHGAFASNLLSALGLEAKK